MAETQMLDDAGVSAREAEVLDALGEHLTNAEIGARLFISVRTVESHVSSLLRKLGVHDRRELSQLAADLTARRTGANQTAVDTPTPTAPTTPAAPTIPVPLTPFVGRATERQALADALGENRLVTAVGPGGVGKTRLAVAVAADLTDRYEGDVWFVDLVPVTDPIMVAPAVAAAIGLGEVSGRSADDAVATALAHCEGLVVLDNCEHLADGAAVFVERLLARCPRLVVLATSRARLVVPFERVFPVPGLSLSPGATSSQSSPPNVTTGRPSRTTATTQAPVPTTGPDGNDRQRHEADGGEDELGDAVTLFLARAAAVGSPVDDAADRRRVAAICRELDGMALAIELAASRLPGLGLDGLEAGLGDRLRLLAGGSRADERHRSLRATLDWSYELLEPVDQAVLRRVSVFAAPFTVDAAVAVAGFDPVPDGKEAEVVVDALGRLADQSLVLALPRPNGTRYRILKTICGYGAGRLEAARESDQTRERHLRWCSTAATELEELQVEHDAVDCDVWPEAFDPVADDLRAGLGWVAAQPERRAEAHALALRFAHLTYRRGLLSESQRRYEQAARLTEGVPAAAALRQAAGAAAVRQAGEEVLRLYQEAGAAAIAAGDDARAARDLAWAAMTAGRCPGIMVDLPPPIDVDAVLAEARALAADDVAANAAIVVAQAFDCYEDADEHTHELARRGVELAQQTGDPLMESAALDELEVVQSARGDLQAAAATTRRRTELLAHLPLNADSGFEIHDAHHMAVEVHIGVGDLRSARRFAEPLLRFPVYHQGHLAASRLVVADALAGEWDNVLAVADRFRAEWERAGRPMVAYLSLGAAAMAMVYGLRGDDTERESWLDVTNFLRTAVERQGRPGIKAWAPTFDAIMLLHRGQVDEAVARLSHDPDEMYHWFSGIWRQWYTALWAEAAVLADHPEAEARLERARSIVAGNPIGTALVDRATAWRHDDEAGLLAAADALAEAACPYQQARALVLAGGEHRTRGLAALSALGATSMPVPARH